MILNKVHEKLILVSLVGRPVDSIKQETCNILIYSFKEVVLSDQYIFKVFCFVLIFSYFVSLVFVKVYLDSFKGFQFRSLM